MDQQRTSIDSPFGTEPVYHCVKSVTEDRVCIVPHLCIAAELLQSLDDALDVTVRRGDGIPCEALGNDEGQISSHQNQNDALLVVQCDQKGVVSDLLDACRVNGSAQELLEGWEETMDAQPLREGSVGKRLLLPAASKSLADRLKVCGIASRLGSEDFSWRTMDAKKRFDRTTHEVVLTRHISLSFVHRRATDVSTTRSVYTASIPWGVRPGAQGTFFVQGNPLLCM